ncbi:hypothetical protein D3C85_1525740 [compost metagenome]
MGIAADHGHVVHRAADRVQFLDLREALQRADHRGRRLRLHGQAAEGQDGVVLHPAAQPHAKAGNHAGLLEPGDARHHRGPGDAQHAGEVGRALARVALQQGQQVPVGLVEVCHSFSLGLTFRQE